MSAQTATATATAREQIARIYGEQGVQRYGRERVSQLQHALQSAALAEHEEASDALVLAALLHDFGHLVASPADQETGHGVDDVHQFLAIPFLRGVVPDTVIEPIRLHVDAKRYLCFAEPDYWAGLSEASKASLELQGGPFGVTAATRFMQVPFAAEALRVRRWDDRAKVPGLATPPLEYYLARLDRLAGAGIGP